MAVEPIVWKLLSELKPKRLLSLGYPDLLLPHGESLPIANDAATIGEWHGWDGQVYDTTAALQTLDCEPAYIDIHASRGIERIVDLNRSLPIDLVGQFDCVLDPGTLEHCFNIGQAFMNCIAALKPTGSIVHTNPLQQINHGFWNISPTAYADWYEFHGFTVELSILIGALGDRLVLPSKSQNRFGVVGEAVNLCVAKRALPADAIPLVVGWPMQRKYRVNPDLKAASVH